MKNKYLLSTFLCLLSASVAQASPHHQQFAGSNNQIKFTSERFNSPGNQANIFARDKQLFLAKDTYLTSLIQQQPSVVPPTQPIPVTTTANNSIAANPSTIIPTVAEADVRNYQTNAALLINDPEPINNKHYLVAQDSLGQVNSVSQLKDVSADDWAYEALRSLSERYNCISGFEDNTFRGKQTLTRYEFAAGLNSCLQKIESLVNSSATVATEDLQTAQRLSREFEAELAAIGGRVDNLEERVDVLEDNQFSTTTILNGEAIFALAGAYGGDPPGGCEPLELNLQNGEVADVVNCGVREGDNAISTADDPDNELVFAYLARLGLQASFSGQDRLRLYLTTGNFDNGGFTNPESFNTYSPRFSYQAGLENQVILDILEYRVPAFNDRVAFYASTFGFALSNVLTANSPYFDIGRGAVSRFGQLNPIFRIGGAMDAGVGFDWLIAEPVRLQFAYGTRDSADPDGGFFGADHSALGVQFLVQPTEDIVTGLTYVNAYSSDGSLGTFTGSVNAETNGLWSGGRLPSSEGGGAFPGAGVEIGDLPAQINAVGGTFQWNFTQNLNLGASAAYTFSNYLDEIPDFDLDGDPGIGNPPVAGEKPFANTLSYQFSLGFSDPFNREGDLFGFIFGMPPKLVDAGPVTAGQSVPLSEQVINNEEPVAVTDNDPRAFLRADEDGDPANGNLRPEGTPEQFGREDEATSLHFEFFYRFKVNDNISVTPGMFIVTNPGHIKDNDTLYVGTIRTTFRF